MNGEKKSSKNIWVWIGKVAVVIGVILGLLQIAQFFKGAEYNISVEGEHSTLSLPPIPDKEFDYLEKVINLDSLKSLLPVVKSESDRTQIAQFILTYFLVKYDDIISLFSQFHSIWVFKIHNKGNKEVTSLNLELPFSGYYLRSQSGQKRVFSDFTDVIPLGSLRPRNEISVVVWSDTRPESYLEENTRVTHSNGASTISYPYQVRGIFASIARNLFPLILLLCLLITVAATAFSNFYESIAFVRKKRKQVNETLKEDL